MDRLGSLISILLQSLSTKLMPLSASTTAGAILIAVPVGESQPLGAVVSSAISGAQQDRGKYLSRSVEAIWFW